MSLDRRQGGLAGALALLLVLALFAAGCGGSDVDSSGAESTVPGGASQLGEDVSVAKAEEFGAEASDAEAKGPEAALRGYLNARANGEGTKVCSYMSKELRELYGRLIKGKGCAELAAKSAERFSANELAAHAEVEVESVRLESDSGYVIYRNAEGSRQVRPVKRESRDWKVNSQLSQLLEEAPKKQ